MEQAPLEPLLLRANEAARLLGVSRSRIYELVAAGTVPSVRLGSSVRIPLQALRQWVSQQAATDGALASDEAWRPKLALTRRT